ncbi:MAG TPA: spermidine/putrescine ABC transporter substrate-binding protein [Lachnospiraceae bacterium]|nr:spermidine/putrescine ABC transporter substrate-binding protein [Lachnospiraceae bacterium]
MKKKVFGLMFAFVLTVGLLSGCGQKGNGELSLYTWDGMFPQEVLTGFEEETGIKIYYSNFDYDEDMLAKLEETQGGDYDLVIADDYIIELAIQEGLVQKLDKEKLTNFSNINPLYQGQFYDETDEYTVPYGAGIPLIVYDKEAVGFEMTSYEDLWNPALEDSVAIIGNYRVIDGIALKTLGESFNTEDLDVIQKAGDKLNELAPNIRLISDSNTQDYIISGEVDAAFLYTSQVNTALAAKPELSVAYPSEGLGFGIMAAFVPSKAPNADAAHAFLEYILRPEISAQCFEYIGYYCTNKAAEEYISEDMRDTLVVPDTVTSGEIVQNISQEAEDLHSEIWKTFQSNCGL